MQTIPETMTIGKPLPEASHSVNIFFDVPGYGKAQATGRGRSADEAAANLKTTIDATRTALAPVPVEPPVRSYTQRLGALLACGLNKATTKGDYGLVERLTKAAALVLRGAVQPGTREGLLTVQSHHDSATWYDVEGWTCTCPDWAKHAKAGEKYGCKHVLSAMLYTRLAEPQ